MSTRLRHFFPFAKVNVEGSSPSPAQKKSNKTVVGEATPTGRFSSAPVHSRSTVFVSGTSRTLPATAALFSSIPTVSSGRHRSVTWRSRPITIPSAPARRVRIVKGGASVDCEPLLHAIAFRQPSHRSRSMTRRLGAQCRLKTFGLFSRYATCNSRKSQRNLGCGRARPNPHRAPVISEIVLPGRSQIRVSPLLAAVHVLP